MEKAPIITASSKINDIKVKITMPEDTYLPDLISEVYRTMLGLGYSNSLIDKYIDRDGEILENDND